MKAQGQDRDVALPIRKLGSRSVWVISITPQPLYPLERDPVPIVHEARWTTGLVLIGVGSPAHKEVQTPDCPAHSRSLYCLCYPGCLIREWDSMIVNIIEWV
jgi:hypothetical protein